MHNDSGTRNLTIVIVNDTVHIAKYCQWDGFPEGQGKTILEFLRDKMDKDKFIQKLKKCSMIESGDKKIEKSWISCGKEPDIDFVSLDVSEKFHKVFPNFSRNVGGNILELVQNSENGVETINDFNFAGDSLFCEWTYVINFDSNFFEVYKGFNKTKLTKHDMFYSLQKIGSEYYPVKLVRKYNLKYLPTNEAFINYFIEQDE